MNEIKVYAGEPIPDISGRNCIAIAGMNSYWLAGGRTATADEIKQYKNPDHPTRIAWEREIADQLGKLDKNTVVIIAPDPGLSLNALRAALEHKLTLFVVRESPMHNIGRFDSGSEEEQLYFELLGKATNVITLNNTEHIPKNPAGYREYAATERPAQMAGRALWIAQTANELISASRITNIDMRAFREQGKPVTSHPPHLSKPKAVQTFYTLPLPSLKVNGTVNLIIPNDQTQSTFVNLNQDTRSFKITPGGLLKLSNVGSATFPHPSQLTQESTLKALLAVINSPDRPESYDALKAKFARQSVTVKTANPDGRFENQLFTNVNRDYATALLEDAKNTSDGSYEAIIDQLHTRVTNELFMTAQELGLFVVENTRTMTVQELAEEIQNNPEKSNLPKELVAACTVNNRIDVGMLTRYVLAVDGIVKPTSEEYSSAEQIFRAIADGEIPAELSEETVEWVKTRIQAEAQAESRFAGQTHKHNPKSGSDLHAETINHLVNLLRTPDKVTVKVAQLRRITPVISGAFDPTLCRLAGMDETRLYAGEIAAWVGNVERYGPAAGATCNLQMPVVFQPSLNQERHPDGYRAPLPDPIATAIEFRNIPNGALPAMRAAVTEVPSILHLPNTLRWLSENTTWLRAQRTGGNRNDPRSRTIKRPIGSELVNLVNKIFQGNLEELQYINRLAYSQQRGCIDGKELIIRTCRIGEDENGQPSGRLDGSQVRGQWPIGDDQNDFFGLKQESLRQIAREIAAKIGEDDQSPVIKEILTLEKALSGRWKQLVVTGGQDTDFPAVIKEIRLGASENIKQLVARKVERLRYLIEETRRTNNFGELVATDEATAQEIEELTQEVEKLKNLVKETLTQPNLSAELKGLLSNPNGPLGNKIAVLCGLPNQNQADAFGQTAADDKLRKLASNITGNWNLLNTQNAIETVTEVLFRKDIEEAKNQLSLQTELGADPSVLETAQANLAKLELRKNTFLQTIDTQRNHIARLASGQVERDATWSSIENRKTLTRSLQAIIDERSTPEIQAKALAREKGQEKMIEELLTKASQATKTRGCLTANTAVLAAYALDMHAINPDSMAVHAVNAVLTADISQLESKSSRTEVIVDGVPAQINVLGRPIKNHTINETDGDRYAALILRLIDNGHLIGDHGTRAPTQGGQRRGLFGNPPMKPNDVYVPPGPPHPKAGSISWALRQLGHLSGYLYPTTKPKSLTPPRALSR